jgi:transcriptional regulator with XRE-family HTH domain
VAVQRLNDRAELALRRAMALSGTERNLSAFARKLSQVAGAGGTTHSSVRRWLEGGTIPAWALLAAAEAASTSVGALLEEAPSDLAEEVARQADEIRRLWVAVGGSHLVGNPLVDQRGAVDEEGARRAVELLGGGEGPEQPDQPSRED